MRVTIAERVEFGMPWRKLRALATEKSSFSITSAGMFGGAVYMWKAGSTVKTEEAVYSIVHR